MNINVSQATDKMASIEVTQLPGKPLPFIFPGIPNYNQAPPEPFIYDYFVFMIIIGYLSPPAHWPGYGAYLQFEYSPPSHDEFFRTILPLPSSSVKHPCLADMFVTLTTLDDIDEILMTTSCTGLNVHVLHLPSDTLEHRVTIVPDNKITIHSDFINDEPYQVNPFMMIRPSDTDHATVSVSYYPDGSVSGMITSTDLILFGHLFTGIALDINEDSVSFRTIASHIFDLDMGSMDMYGQFMESNNEVVIHVTSEVTDPEFVDHDVRLLIQNEIQIYDDRHSSLKSTIEQVQKLFYHYSDLLGDLQQDLDTYSTLYDEMITKINNLTNLQAIHQHSVDQLLLTDMNELIDILNVCDTSNCSSECAIEEVCDVCDNVNSFTEWSVGMVMEQDEEIITYKKNMIKNEWTVGYFCRLITNIKAWGKTVFGQNCSYKADFDDNGVRSSQWLTESKECNTSHFRSIDLINDHSLIIDSLCLSNNSNSSCGMELQSSHCVASNTACTVAQKKLIDNLPMKKQEQLDSLKQLLDIKSDLSVAKTQAEQYRYMIDSTKCRAQYIHRIVLSLYNQKSQLEDSYNTFMIDNGYMEKIKSLLVNYTVEDLFLVKKVSFDVIVNDNFTSTFPLLIEYEINALNTTHELLVMLDFKSPETIIERDISLAVLKALKKMLSTSNSRRKRSCEVAEPSVTEHHFEEYCARINSIKDYLLEVNQSLNTMDAYNEETLQQFEALVEYSLAGKNDLLSVDIDLTLLNSYLNTPTTLSDLIQLAFTSQEYTALVNALDTIDNTSQSVSKLIENTVGITWWKSMNELHLTSYKRIIDSRVCHGLGDCLKMVTVVLDEVINDYPFGDGMEVVDNTKLSLAMENIERIAELDFTGLTTGSSIWSTLLEPLYSVTLTVDTNTNWCTQLPVFVKQPDEFVYLEMGTDTELECMGSEGVIYQWYENGFPISESNNHLLHVKDEGQYHCTISNDMGTVLSRVSNVHLYTYPDMVLSPTNQTAYEGNEDDAVFVCNATGFPTPSYNWYFSNDTENWTLIEGKSNELVVYKPTLSDQGWYKCIAYVYHHQTNASGMAYLHVIGASISTLSYIAEFNMAIYSPNDEINPLQTENEINGLHETIESSITKGQQWSHVYIDNMNATILPNQSTLEVSFQLSTRYEYSLDMKIAEQAKEADKQNAELLLVVNGLLLRLDESSISFEYKGDFYYTFPQTFNISNAIYRCGDGQELMNNTFICGKFYYM